MKRKKVREMLMERRTAAQSRRSAQSSAETLADRDPSDPPRRSTTSSRSLVPREDNSPATI
jgi:hypothetical protein